MFTQLHIRQYFRRARAIAMCVTKKEEKEKEEEIYSTSKSE